MKYLIDAHNTVSAGTINVTKNFIEGLFNCEDENDYYIVLPRLPEFDKFNSLRKSNIHLISIPQYSGLLQLVSRILYQSVTFPIFAFFIRPKSILIFGNYALLPWKNKVVMMQQLYLIDDSLYHRAKFKIRTIEGIVRLLFRFTLISTSKVIVQRNLLKKCLSAKYNIKNGNVIVLPSPVSDVLTHAERSDRVSEILPEKMILFVSRYYKHKNHKFIIKISEKYSKELREKNMRFYVTLDPSLSKEVAELIGIIKEKKLDDLIKNISEVPQDKLIVYYRKATVLFFPSNAESFGLPIVEAMACGLPVIVPDLEYAHEICEDAGIYYREDDADDAYKRLVEICENKELWDYYSKKSLEQYKKFPTVEEWVKDIIAVIR